jgi:hypothetical protein
MVAKLEYSAPAVWHFIESVPSTPDAQNICKFEHNIIIPYPFLILLAGVLQEVLHLIFSTQLPSFSHRSFLDFAIITALDDTNKPQVYVS